MSEELDEDKIIESLSEINKNTGLNLDEIFFGIIERAELRYIKENKGEKYGYCKT